VKVVLNGGEVALEAGATVADALLSLGRGAEARGTAVALNGEVVSRAAWETVALREGDRLEVLTAVQGG
jgi:sulfur carrier protein